MVGKTKTSCMVTSLCRICLDVAAQWELDTFFQLKNWLVSTAYLKPEIKALWKLKFIQPLMFFPLYGHCLFGKAVKVIR